MADLKDITLFLLDMDGTFYLGDKILDGSEHFMGIVNADPARDYVFLTNNSSKSRKDYIQKLARMGYPFPDDKVMTSGEATIIYVRERMPNAKIYLVGTPSLEQEFKDAGFVLTDEKPDLAVLGFDTTLTYHKMQLLCDFVRAGVPYVATHPDFNCPVEGGYIPDIGAMIAFVEASTGKKPLVIGKPNRYIIDSVAEKFGIPPSQIAMVGDRLYTDIAVGKNAGITSVLVLSGETTEQDLKGSKIVPDYIFKNLGELADHL